jgi:predicted flavoprotein YhiN
MHLPFIFFFLLTFCVQLPKLIAIDIQTDVCIYGATPGGIAAALAAAKSGSEVILIEPTKRIGGMTTSGLSHTDFHSMESLTGTYLHFSQGAASGCRPGKCN